MRSVSRKLFACLLIVSLFFTTSSPVYAATDNPSAVYDLETGGSQTFTLTDSSGNNILITIEEISSTTRSLENRSYKVSYRALLSWEAGYTVIINNNSISSVNSPYYACFMGTIFSSILKKDSSKQATLSFIYKVGGINIPTGVRTTIVNEQLKVTVL